MKTQKARLLEYLQTHKQGITAGEAFLKLGIARCSERIRELEGESWHDWTRNNSKQKTYTIWHKSEKVSTRYGTATVTRYSLA